MAIKRFGLGVLAGILACVVAVPIAQQRRARRIRPVISLLTIVFRLIPRLGVLATRPANRLLYEFVNRRGVAETVSVMNYGYAPAGATNSLTLPPGKEQERIPQEEAASVFCRSKGALSIPHLPCFLISGLIRLLQVLSHHIPHCPVYEGGYLHCHG